MATASLVGRRFGPAVSGWLVGMPFTSGPIALFLYLDHGSGFAANAAVGAMLGVLPTIAWAVAYSAVAARGAGPVASLLAGLSVYTLIGATVRDISIAPVAVYVLIAILLIIAIRGIRPPAVSYAVRPPDWDLPARMVLATILVLAITGSSLLLGPRLSGLLAVIPLYASILAAFAHRQAGGAAAIHVWRGLFFGLFGFGAFYLVLATLIDSLGLAAFALALAASLTSQAVTMRMVRANAAAPMP